MTLHGFDIARDQAGWDPDQQWHDFAIIGASDGGTVNPHFHSQYANEKRSGKLRGAYHFFRGNPAGEAAFFVANASEVAGDGQTWCDAETAIPNLPNLVLAWLNEVWRLTGVKPAGVYTMAYFLIGRDAYDWTPVYDAGYALWEAAYVAGYQPIAAYNVPGGRAPVSLWGSPIMWQYTSSGQVAGWGGGTDLNVFYGTADGWAGLVHGGTVTGQASSITPITTTPTTEDGFLMALSDADQAEVLTNLRKLVYGQDTAYAAIKEVPNLTASATLDKQLTKSSGQGATSLALELVYADANRAAIPVNILNQPFTVNGRSVNLAGLLAALDAKPGTQVTLDTAQVNALADQIRATLPAATLAALAQKLA